MIILCARCGFTSIGGAAGCAHMERLKAKTKENCKREFI